MTESSRRPTLADVARLAGTSTAVVSYVVNDGPRPVAAATRARVERAILELGYRRNPLAGALSIGTSNLVGLLVPDTANGFFGELSKHVEVEGRRRGLLTMLGNTGYDGDVAAGYVTAFSDLRPRGVLMTSVAGATPPTDVPIVFVHAAPSPSTPARPSVTVADVDGAATATRHLVEHGHRAIHCLSGDDPGIGGPATVRERGWRQVLDALGERTEGRVHRAAYDRVDAEHAAMRMLTGDDRPTAVVATTDEHALGLMRAAAELGLRVPEDVAVVGFDGIREALGGSRRITTMAVPLDVMASRAFDLIDAATAEAVVLDARLVIGETCGCATTR